MTFQTAIVPALNAQRQTFPEAFPEGLMPRLRLFLSVDLVGSTRHKQTCRVWRPEILNFYSSFDHIFRSEQQAFKDGGAHDLPDPEFWKSNGDELLYVCELDSLSQAHAVIHVWLSTLRAYRSAVGAETTTLDVKSTAWVGLFPLPNSEVFFLRGGARQNHRDPVLAQSELRDAWYADRTGSAIIRDFVGPSIDTGFRLTSWASPNRMIVSVDLAFLLTGVYTPGLQPLALNVSGKDKLRGVIDDQPYPMIWIPVGGRGEMGPVNSGIELAATNHQTIRRYCEMIIELNYQSITPLHLAGAHCEDFGWTPPYIIDRILRHWQDEVRHRSEIYGTLAMTA